MRVTNNMIMKNASSNINGTKEVVNKRNTQMTTQKKISKPSEDPVVAIRSLRLATTLSKVNQYYQKNIPDAEHWLDVTETALINMKELVNDARKLAVNGATDTLTQTDRNTILTQLKALQDQLFLEGNSNYAGRTVFTGFRTDKNLVFTDDEDNTKYNIQQKFTGDDIEEYRYYAGNVEVPSTKDQVLNNDISDTIQSDYYRLRLNYDDIEEGTNPTFKYSYVNGAGATVEETLSTPTAGTYSVYDNEKQWGEADPSGNGQKSVGDDEIVFIRESGQFIFGKNITESLKGNHAEITIDYEKHGFKAGQLRPEYYYDCTKVTDEHNSPVNIDFKKFDDKGEVINFDINYTVAINQELTVNLEASNIFDSSIQRDVGEMINVVEKSIAAHGKIDTIKAMIKEPQYAGDDVQERLQEWLDKAQKEADYADDNLQKLYSTEIGKIDKYLSKINLSLTKLGCTADSLALTKSRMQDQQETVLELQSLNDDVDLSQIIIDYTAAHTAYQSSLTAAGKLGEISLLNYI